MTKAKPFLKTNILFLMVSFALVVLPLIIGFFFNVTEGMKKKKGKGKGGGKKKGKKKKKKKKKRKGKKKKCPACPVIPPEQSFATKVYYKIPHTVRKDYIQPFVPSFIKTTMQRIFA